MKDQEDTGGVVLTGDEGRTILQVECGQNKAVLHLDKLCQGSKGACVLFDDAWMTPNEFQAASGRELAKDWKRSIKHHDKSLKLLIIKCFLFLDPAVCRCEHCVPSSSSHSTESPTITTSPSESKNPKVGMSVVVNVVQVISIMLKCQSHWNPLVCRSVPQFLMFALLCMTAVEI